MQAPTVLNGDTTCFPCSRAADPTLVTVSSQIGTHPQRRLLSFEGVEWVQLTKICTLSHPLFLPIISLEWMQRRLS